MRNVLMIGAFVGLSASVPILYQASPETFRAVVSPAPSETPATPAAATPPPGIRASPVAASRSVTVSADATGHFRTEMRVNGRKVEGLIDTGATLVAMNETTARRAGISIARSEFRHEVNTANGKAKAAVVRIDMLEIGRIRLPGVEAMVLDDRSLHTTLIGMNALKQLARFEVKDDVLLLEQ